MNIAKNMELIFVAAIAIISTTTFATAGSAASHKVSAPEVVKVGAAPTMTVITVSAKRLTAAEKAALAD